MILMLPYISALKIELSSFKGHASFNLKVASYQPQAKWKVVASASHHKKSKETQPWSIQLPSSPTAGARSKDIESSAAVTVERLLF